TTIATSAVRRSRSAHVEQPIAHLRLLAAIMPEMSPDSDIAEIEAELATKSSAHRSFFVPILRALVALGGRARKRDVVIKIRELLADELDERQLDYLETKNRFGWSRNDLVKAGLIAGEYGWWELTDSGRAFA